VSLHDWDDSGIGGLGCIKQRDLSEASRIAPTVKLERSSVAPEVGFSVNSLAPGGPRPGKLPKTPFFVHHTVPSGLSGVTTILPNQEPEGWDCKLLE
jgi:hypothetical protein